MADPLFPPLHETSLLRLVVAVGPRILATFTVEVSVHAFPSVTVTVYVPVSRLFVCAVLPPPGDHV